MDPIRTLLLARTHTVVLDPDRVASAATRPTRDADLEKFEDDLAQLGYVMSLDLAMTMRRLPFQAIAELRAWIAATLAMRAERARVPLAQLPGEPSPYLRRMATWLATNHVQPCPWCGQDKPVAALDPCGHLVCRSCWDTGSFAGCPICHRRVALGDPFTRPQISERVSHHDGTLRLVHLGFDLVGAARARFEHLVARSAPLSPDDRAELEGIIDAMGPRTVQWLPIRIPVKQTMAVALARLWTVAADRIQMVRQTRIHLTSATDVLRVAVVLLGGNPELAEPMRLRSLGRGMRRAVLEAVDHLAPDEAIEDMWRRRGLWKRVGERLHPYEYAERLPFATLAFAAIRQTRLDTATFGPAMRSEARDVTTVRIADNKLVVTPWAGAVEDRLRAGDARGAAERLGQRPRALLRRVDHLVRVAQARQPDALAAVLGAVESAATRGTPELLLGLASQLAQRTAPWPRRVYVARTGVLSAWAATDERPPLRGDAIGALVATMRAELVERAAARRNFARAVIDRSLGDLRAPSGGRTQGLPRGSELALPAGPIHLAGEQLAVELFDARWRYLNTCHGGELPAGVAHAIAVVFGKPKLVTVGDRRFALRPRTHMTVALAIDVAARTLRWLDVAVPGRAAIARAGGYHALLAHLGRDHQRARPSLFDIAAIHAVARANILYVRERGAIASYRRRDHEQALARLARVHAGDDPDDMLGALPTANAPTWFALVTEDIALPPGSAGYALVPSSEENVDRLSASDLIGDLAR